MPTVTHLTCNLEMAPLQKSPDQSRRHQEPAVHQPLQNSPCPQQPRDSWRAVAAPIESWSCRQWNGAVCWVLDPSRGLPERGGCRAEPADAGGHGPAARLPFRRRRGVQHAAAAALLQLPQHGRETGMPDTHAQEGNHLPGMRTERIEEGKQNLRPGNARADEAPHGLR